MAIAQCQGFRNVFVKESVAMFLLLLSSCLEDLLSNMHSLKNGVNEPRRLGPLYLAC